MKDLLANQRNKTGRLRFISLLFALLLLPLGAWADSYFRMYTGTGWTGVSDTEGEDYNVNDILGDGTASYDPVSNILTLNGISMTLSNSDGNAFIMMNDADYQSLTVRLVGENSLTLSGNAEFFYGTNVTFVTSATASGSLTITTADGWTGSIYEGYYSSENIGVVYCDKLRMAHIDGQSTYTIQTVEPTGTSYNLTVAGTPVTSGNATDVLGNGKVSFSANTIPVKLSFTGRNYINYPGHCLNTTESIEIDVEESGNLYLNSTGDGNYPFYSANDVQIQFNSNFDANIQGKNVPAFSPKCVPDFASSGAQIVYSDNGYKIKAYEAEDFLEFQIDGNFITSDNKSNILGDGSVSFTEGTSSGTLTLNNANIGEVRFSGDYANFTINLTGTNYITKRFNDSFLLCYYYPSENIDPTLTFTGDGELWLQTDDENFTSADYDFVVDENGGTTDNVDYSANFTTGGWSKEFISATNSPNGKPYLRIYKAPAPTSYGITVAGTAVTSANASNVLNDDYSSVSYNASTNTLTLKGVHLNSTNNGISVSSDLNINLVGYSNVGTINVTSGTLNFTTSTTLPGCLKTNITGNSTITYGAGTGLSWDGTMVKSSGTNPYIIYATGYKGDDDEYGNDNGDIVAYNNNGSQVELGNPDVTVVNSQNNASIDYFRVPSVSGDPVSSFLYPIDLEDNTLYTKAYFLFDWGTCTNRDVKVRVREYNSNSSPNSGEFRSNEVSLPSDGGLVEIPLTGTVTSDLILLYFTSTTGEFSFIPISVGFQKTESYGLTVGGVAVTNANASNIFGQDYATASYDNASNTLTLSGCRYDDQTSSFVSIGGSLESLTLHLVGYNEISGVTKMFSSTNACIVNVTTDATVPGKLVYYGESTNMTDNVTLNFGTSGLAPDGTTIEAVSGTSDICYFGIGQFYDDDPNSDYPYCAYTNSIIWYFSNAAITNGNNSYPPIVKSSAGNVSRMKTSGSAIIKSLTLQYVPVSGGTINVALKSLDGVTTYATGTLANGLVTLTPNTKVTYDDVCLTFTSESAFSFVPLAVKTIEPEIIVAGVPVTEQNASGITGTDITGTVTFTPAGDTTPATLTLSNASITGSLQWNSPDNLTIAINGECSITNIDGDAIELIYGDEATPTLTFTKAASATTCSLTLTPSADRPSIDDECFNISYGEGLGCLTGSTSTAGSAAVIGLIVFSGGGNGTSSTPYVLQNATDLANFASYFNNGVLNSDVCVQLGSNIDCTNTTITSIGSNLHPFTGTFDGNNKMISNLEIRPTDEGANGLFSHLNGGTIKKLTIKNCYVTGSDGTTIGVIAGVLVNGTIQDCTVTSCTVQSGSSSTYSLYVGGIAGEVNKGTVTGCTIDDIGLLGATSSTSDLESCVGGVVGVISNNGNVTISSCQLTTVAGSNMITSRHGTLAAAGGIVGAIYASAENTVTISGNTVTAAEGTDITCSDSSTGGEGNYYSGAIVGYKSVLGTLTMSNNTYEYGVMVQKIVSGETTEKSGYTQRGLGDEEADIIANNGAVLITKTLTVNNINYECESSYEPLDVPENGISAFAPGEPVTITLSPEDDEYPSSVSLVYTPEGGTEQTVALENVAETPGYYVYSFEMPSVNATLSVTLADIVDYHLTVAGIAVTSANASNITGEGIDGGKVSYDAATSTLTLNGPEQQYGILSLYTNENNPEPMITCNGDLTIQLIGNNGINFSGSYSNYAIKNTGNSGTLTITQSGTDVALNITTEKNEGASMGLCDGFTAVNFANGLAYTVRNGSRTISTLDLASPVFNVNENEISFSLSTGLLYGTSNGAIVAAEYFYKITYVDASTEGSGVEHELASDFPSFNLDASQKIAVKDLAGACTIEAYTKLNGATSTANKAKKFGPAESPMRLVYGADPVDLVLAPAIEDGDGIKINGIESNVTYNTTTGKVSSETMGSQGGIVSLSYASETVQTLLLNNYFDMDFDVVPPAPTINLAAGEYLNTHANVTVTSAELTNTTIKYQWDDGDATDYPSEGGIPLQTGTLKAWVVYTAGDTPLASDVSEAAFTVLNPAIAMSVYEGQSNEKRLLLQNESGMSMYYAIDYVSTDLNDVPETLYGQAPELLGPCTVTAYAKSGSVQGTTFTGKLFGFAADAVTTSYAAQANAPAIVPDFNGSVTYDYSDWVAYLSVNAQGQITPIKVTQAGNAASVSATFIFSENPSFTVLNAEGPSQAATNYIVDGAFSVTINPLELTVTPDNVTVDAGETIVLTFKYAGFAEGEDKTFLTTEPTASYGNADVTKPGSYTITVSGGEAQNYTFVYETGTLTVKRRLNVSFGENNEWATYCATEDLATPQGLQAYQVTNVSGTTVSTEEVGYIPKNTAVLLKMTNADYVLSASAYTGATSTFDTTNKLEGTTEATSVSEINGNVYVLYNDQFVKATSGTIPALRGYLVVSTTNARALDIVIGDATGFSDVRGQMEDAQETIYNLQGQRVSKAQKGLVIVNGKKVVKK